jgi:hypothetical protein
MNTPELLLCVVLERETSARLFMAQICMSFFAKLYLCAGLANQREGDPV